MEWDQPIDYEHIPFIWHKFHEHGHLFRDYPKNKEIEKSRVDEQKYKEGYTKVSSKKTMGRKKGETTLNNILESQNAYAVLDVDLINQEKET